MKFKNMKSLAVGIVGMLALGMSAQAHALKITPGDTISGNDLVPATTASNCEPECVYLAFGLTNDGSLSLLYKADVDGGKESGSFFGNYDTTFSNSSSDPSDALIEYITGTAIACPSCYLAIKDGNQSPSYYFYDLSKWNGTDDIELVGFWPGNGAISHVSIWGKGGQVPEPASLALLGLGLVGLGFARRRKAVA